MKSYYRVMLGKNSAFAEQCFAGNFIGADCGIAEDLTHKLPDEWRAFNQQFIPLFLAGHPDKNKISAGLACGALWNIAKGIRKGDMVICPDDTGACRVGDDGSVARRPGLSAGAMRVFYAVAPAGAYSRSSRRFSTARNSGADFSAMSIQ